jgi:secernin
VQVHGRILVVCDLLCALQPATGGPTLFAKNSDRPPGEAQPLEWLPPRTDQGPIRATHVEVDPAPGGTLGVLGSRPAWGWGLEHGVNEAGVAVGNATIYTTLDPRTLPPALTGMDIVRLALERSPDTAAAVDEIVRLVEQVGQGGTCYEDRDHPYFSSFLVADPTRAVVIETSGGLWAAEEVERSRATSNRTTIPAFDAEHCLDTGGLLGLFVDPRLAASCATLEHEPVTVDGLCGHLRSHAGGDDGWTICMHVDGQEATTASVVAELAEGSRPVANVSMGWPCRSVFVPVVVGHPLGEVPAWERFEALADPGGDAVQEPLRALEAELAATVVDDPAWNAEAWARVAAILP